MKKKLLLLLISLCIVIRGYFLFHQYKKKQLVKEAHKRAEEFIYRNYEEIESVYVNPNDFHISPMNALSVDGYVNDDSNLDFSIIFNLEDNRLGQVISVTEDPGFPNQKEECQSNFCE